VRRPWARSYGFGLESWDDIKARLTVFGADYIVEVVNSIQRELPPETLVGSSLMGGDLVVRPIPVPDSPYDVVAVRGPSSLRGAESGMVAIEHLSVTGRNGRIERPISETIPLFWRFMIEKYGIHPRRDGAPVAVKTD
jgi:hypothetical protein